MSKRFTFGNIIPNGAAILDNGKQITITETLNNLNRLEELEQLKLNGVGKRTCNNCLYCIINNKSEFNYDKYICTEGYHKNTISDIHNYGCNKFEKL